MSADRDMTRIVRSWLRTDVHESADRVLDTVLARLDTTPQRRSWWPAWRTADMNTFAKLTIAAAAVVVVAVVGINLLPASSGVGGSAPAVSSSPSPSPSPTPQPSPSPTPAAVFPPAGELAIGRHSMTLDGVPLSFGVPTSGWTSNGVWGIDKSTGIGPDGAGFILWPDEAPIGVFADPCAHVQAPPIGASAAKLAAAVAAVPGTDLVSGPSDVTVGGYPAKHVVLTFGKDADCNADGRLTGEEFYLWYAPSEGNARYATELGSTIRVWIIDVGGTIVWIDGETYKGAGPEPGQEIQQIVDSIQFE
jgi:hypothetical protein